MFKKLVAEYTINVHKRMDKLFNRSQFQKFIVVILLIENFLVKAE